MQGSSLHCITLHYIALHYIALHCIALHCIVFHSLNALHCIASKVLCENSFVNSHTLHDSSSCCCAEGFRLDAADAFAAATICVADATACLAAF